MERNFVRELVLRKFISRIRGMSAPVNFSLKLYIVCIEFTARPMNTVLIVLREGI